MIQVFKPAQISAPNQATPSLDAKNYKHFTFQLSAIGGEITVRIESSLDGTNWWNLDENNRDIILSAGKTEGLLWTGVTLWIRVLYVAGSGAIAAIILMAD